MPKVTNEWFHLINDYMIPIQKDWNTIRSLYNITQKVENIENMTNCNLNLESGKIRVPINFSINKPLERYLCSQFTCCTADRNAATAPQ